LSGATAGDVDDGTWITIGDWGIAKGGRRRFIAKRMGRR
jgi:hypothetical protein